MLDPAAFRHRHAPPQTKLSRYLRHGLSHNRQVNRVEGNSHVRIARVAGSALFAGSRGRFSHL